MANYKIALIFASESELKKIVRIGFLRGVDFFLPKECEVIDYFVDPHSPDELVQEQLMRFLLDDEIDLIVPIGNKSAQLAYNATSERRRKTPIVFAATGDPVALGFTKSIESSGNHLTGAFVETASRPLPIQCLLRLNPYLDSVLVPYRPEASAGLMQYEANRVKIYFAKQKVKTLLFSCEGAQLDFQKISTLIKQTDAVVILEGSMLEHDIEKVQKICKEHGKVFFPDPGEEIQQNVVFGSRKKLEYVGVYAAQQAIKILAEGVAPSDIPIKAVSDTRWLARPTLDGTSSHGTVLSEEIVSAVEQDYLRQRDVNSYLTCLVDQSTTCLNRNALLELSFRMRVEGDAHFHYNSCDGYLSNAQPDIAKRDQVQVLSEDELFEAFVLMHEPGSAKMLVEYMITHELPRPVVYFSTDMDEDVSWHTRAKENGVFVSRILLPPQDGMMQLRLLTKVLSDLRAVTLVVAAHPENLPAPLKQRVAQLRTTCEKQGMTLEVVGSDNVREMNELLRNGLPGRQACFFLEEFMPSTSLHTFAQKLREQGVVCCSGSLLGGRLFPLSCGVDGHKLRDVIFAPLKRQLHEAQAPLEHTTLLDSIDMYRVIVNEELCEALGITPVAAPGEQIFDHLVVDVDHAFHAALAVGLVTRDKQDAGLRNGPVIVDLDMYKTEREKNNE